MAVESDPKFFLLHRQSWLDAENFEKKILGSVIQEFADPAGSDFIPENPLKYYKEGDFIENTFNDFVIDNNHSSSHESNANINSLGGAKLIGALEDKVELKGKRIHTKRLQRYPKFWESLKGDSQVQAQLPYWIGIKTLWKPVCLVVGIMICEDIDISSQTGASRQMSLHGKAPVVDTVLPGSGPVLGETMNIEGRLAAEQNENTHFSGKCETRKIFALQLKNVTTPWFRNRKVEWKLKKYGPEVPKIRLLEHENQDESGADHVSMNDLVLDDIADEDFDDFVS